MAITNFIAAIELGSSKIRGIAGTKKIDGSIQIHAYAEVSSSDSIKKGKVYNRDGTSLALKNIIKKLEKELGETIEKVYVGISGQSLRSEYNSISRSITSEDTKIDQELIDSLCDENLELKINDLDILSVEPQEYKIGNNLEINPVGVASEHIEGRYLNIVANSNVKESIEYCFKQADIKIEDLLVTPLTTADIILSEKEKRAGCALIDFGADTTTISIYRDNILRFLTLIPLGGENITKDIISLQIDEDEAETIKLSIGSAWYDKKENDKEEEKAIHTLEDGRKVKIEDIQLAIEARSEEIVLNVWNQIKYSGYNDKLLAGLILTGGTSKMNNLHRLIQEKTTIGQIRFAESPLISFHNSDKINGIDKTKYGILGLLNAGKENCCLIPITDKPGVLFDDKEVLITKEEEERKKKEAQEEIERKKSKDEKIGENNKNPDKKGDNFFTKFTQKVAKDLFGNENYESEK